MTSWVRVSCEWEGLCDANGARPPAGVQFGGRVDEAAAPFPTPRSEVIRLALYS